MKKIAVIDVAAERGGALSVLKDFEDYIKNFNQDCVWYFITSVHLGDSTDNVVYIKDNFSKKSWLHRLWWDKFKVRAYCNKYNFDVVFSLQNNAFKNIKAKQATYFHNVLLLEDKNKYSLLKSEERKYAIYTKFISKYTLNSLKNSNLIIAQTKTVVNVLKKRIQNVNIINIAPNVNVEEKYINCAQYDNEIKGLIYPTAPVPFKKIELVLECAIKNREWFIKNGKELIITIDGTENLYSKNLKKMIEGETHIKLIGYVSREKIFEYYRNYALITSSELESYPLLYEEANVVGTPIIAANYDYAKEILSDKRLSYLYDKNDVDNLFDSIKKAMTNRITGPNQFSKVNTWETVVNHIVDM